MDTRKFTQLIQSQNIDLCLQGSSDTPSYCVVDGVRVVNLGIPVLELMGSQDFQRTIADSALHEIGHLWVAPKSRRNKKNYGIPEGADEEFWTWEDMKADLVHDELGRLLGIEFRGGLEISEFVEQWWELKGRDRTITLWERAINFTGEGPMNLDT